MNQTVKFVGAIALACMMVTTAVADDKPEAKKKGARGGKAQAGAQLMKQLEAVGLTDEQLEKAKDLRAEVVKAMAALRKEGLNGDLQKKRAALMKKAREAGKKGKDLAAAAKEGFTDVESELLTKAAALNGKLRSSIIGMLTDEQKEKLPEALKKQLAGKKAGGKGKKNKKADKQ